jgi:peptidoglycan hydrolase-like protein with peptidoglycan-binding domain
MPTKKVHLLAVAVTGGLVLAGVTTAAMTNTGHTPTTHEALAAANLASSSAVNLDDCPTLAEGSPPGGCVIQLQTELNTDNNTTTPVDGVFGPQTKAAVKTFQQEHNIVPADGIVGPQTKAALGNPGSSSAGTPPGQLNPGERITSGTQIASPDGKFVLQMQSDGNLVLRAPGNIPLGNTHTAGNDGTIAVMQTDGNFVLRAPGNIPIWASGTNGYPGTVLQVQDDGGVVLYAPGHQVLRVIFPASPDPQNSQPTPTAPPATASASAPSASASAPSATESTAPVSSLPVVIPGTLTSTIYFNKKQTDYFDSDEGQACAFIAAAALPIPGVGEIGEFVAGACELDAAVIELQASRATARNMCLKIKFTNTQIPILWPDIYRGQYCD